MAKAAEKSNASNLKVCLLSPHPMVLDEFKRLLENCGLLRSLPKQLDSMLAPDLRHLEIPKAAVYVWTPTPRAKPRERCSGISSSAMKMPG